MYDYRKMTPQEQRETVEQRQTQNRPWHRLPHRVDESQTYILTSTCWEHAPILDSPERRAQLSAQLHEVMREHEAVLFAWCILPNHYHLLVQCDVALVMKSLGRLHGATSRAWNLEDDRVGRSVWYGCCDRSMRSEAHFYASMNYIHANPVKHRYAKRAELWDASSFDHYLELWGRQALREMWFAYPVLDYGKGWDWT